MTLHSPLIHDFVISGQVSPLFAPLRKAGGHVPSRPLGGWLMTYGKLGPQGGVVPTVDRDGQTMEAARELGHIDWSPYLNDGKWNDTHDEGIIVGVPETLEFHDGTTELSQEHGKLGFWTAGHLFDRNDPSSWSAYTDYVPTEVDLDRADHFWALASLLKGLPRPLGFSAHGSMALSPCRSRIIWCQVRQAAVCELPKNPDSTAEVLAKGALGPLEIMRKGMVGRKPCGRCSCPPWACEGLLRKGTGQSTDRVTVRTNSGGDGHPSAIGGEHNFKEDDDDDDGGSKMLRWLVRAIQERYFVDEPTAKKWIRRHFSRSATTSTGASHG